jgi:hypothetical protein
MVNCIIWKENLARFTAERVNFNEFKPGRPHDKQAVIAWYLGTVSASP